MGRKPKDRVSDGDIVLTWDETEEMGLDEAPADAGPSWEEIERSRQGGGDEERR